MPFLGVRTPSQIVGHPLLGNAKWPVLTVAASTQLILGSFGPRAREAGAGVVDHRTRTSRRRRTEEICLFYKNPGCV